MGEENPDSLSTMHSTKKVRILLSPQCIYQKKKIPGANFFPDKFSPVSGFAIKRQFFQIFFNKSFRYSQIDPFSWSPMSMMSPGCPVPVFLAGIRFSKNLIFEVYKCSEIFWWQFFPQQKLSGIRFFPNLPGFPDFL